MTDQTRSSTGDIISIYNLDVLAESGSLLAYDTGIPTVTASDSASQVYARAANTTLSTVPWSSASSAVSSTVGLTDSKCQAINTWLSQVSSTGTVRSLGSDVALSLNVMPMAVPNVICLRGGVPPATSVSTARPPRGQSTMGQTGQAAGRIMPVLGGKFDRTSVEARTCTTLHPHLVLNVRVNHITFKTLYHALCWAILEVNDGTVVVGSVNNMSVSDLAVKLAEVRAAKDASWDDNWIVCVCFYVLQVINRYVDFKSALSTMLGWSFKYRDMDAVIGTTGTNRGCNIYGKSLTMACSVCNLLGAIDMPLNSFMVGLNSLFSLRSSPASTFNI